MTFGSLADQLVAAGFATFGEAVTVTPRGGGASAPAVAIINREAEAKDDFGVTVDSRIEVELRHSEVAQIERGLTVDTGSQVFRLLEPIADNGRSSRWTASEG